MTLGIEKKNDPIVKDTNTCSSFIIILGENYKR